MDNYYKSKEFMRILEQYENPKDSTYLLDTNDYADIAQYYHIKGDDKKALEAVHTALNIYPGSIGPLSFLSRYALLEEQNLKKAKEIADSIEDKNDPDYVLLAAEIMIADNKPDEADSYLQEAYSRFYGDDYYDDMPLDVAILFADYDEVELAEEWLKLSDETDEDDYLETKARILIGEGKYKEAEDIINKLLNNDPYSTNYWNLLSTAQAQDGNVKESINSADYALAIEPDNSDALLQKANGLMALENFDEAEKLYKRYTEEEPRRDTGYMMVGLALVAQDRPQESLKYFNEALKANRKSVKDLWQNRVDIYFQISSVENYLEHYSKVHEYLNKIVDIYEDKLSGDIDEFGTKVAEIDCAHGHVCLEEEKIEEAIDWFEQAVYDSNGSTAIYAKIGATAYECGYVEYAYNILHELLVTNEAEDDLGFRILILCCKYLKKEQEEQWAQSKLEKILKSQDK